MGSWVISPLVWIVALLITPLISTRGPLFGFLLMVPICSSLSRYFRYAVP